MRLPTSAKSVHKIQMCFCIYKRLIEARTHSGIHACNRAYICKDQGLGKRPEDIISLDCLIGLVMQAMRRY